MVMDYEGFKKEIFTLTGIDLGSYKEKQMKRRIDALINKNGIENYTDYVKTLKSDSLVFKEFINYITINVTEFYRNPGQWKVLEEEVLPELLRNSKNLKIWSTACSTGEEPYTLVMVLSKLIPLANIKIIATDIDKQAIEKAKAGIYSSKSIENLPVEMKNRFFTKEGDNYLISNDIKRCVDFKRINLLCDEYPKECDLIVCRNVLIYFTEEAKSEIYIKFAKSLKKGGVLFVGSTEQIIMSQKYNLKPMKTFFYKRLE